MWPIAADVARTVVCVSVCVFVTRMCAAKTAEPIQVPFRRLIFVFSGSHVFDGCGIKIGQIHLQPWDDKSAMWRFAKLLWTLV